VGEAIATGRFFFLQETSTHERHLHQRFSRNRFTLDLDQQALMKVDYASNSHTQHGDVDEALICETRFGPNAHEISHICHVVSVFILVLMLLECLLKLWIDPDHFLHNPFEVLDLVVVVLSLFADVVILPMVQNSDAKSAAETAMGLLLLCRLWRIVRIVHGVVLVAHIAREDIGQQGRIGQLEALLKQNNIALPGEEKLERAKTEPA
jgi:hypothetical protein